MAQEIPGRQTLTLSRILSDNNTDSEVPVTETEDEGTEQVCVPLVTHDELKVIEQLGSGQFGEVKANEKL